MTKIDTTTILILFVAWGCAKRTKNSSEQTVSPIKQTTSEKQSGYNHTGSQEAFTDKKEIDSNEPKIAESTFQDYYFNIPYLELPLTIDCGFSNTFNQENFTSSFSKFIPDNLEVVGKFESSKGINLISYARVGDILYPYLYTYNDKGDKIDSIYLHITTCAEDPVLEYKTLTQIDSDLVISMIDTTSYYNYVDMENDYSRTLDSAIVTTRKVIINDDGFFVVENQRKERIKTVGNNGEHP